MTNLLIPFDFKPKDEWPNKKFAFHTYRLPLGYKRDDDARLFIPNNDEIYFIEIAFDYLEQGNALRPTAVWLSEQLKRNCSHMTLQKLWHQKRYNDKENPRAIALRRQRQKNSPKTKEEKARKEAARRLSTSRRSLTYAKRYAERVEYANKTPEQIAAEKVINSIEEEEKAINALESVSGPLIERDFTNSETPIPAIPSNVKVVFEPHPGPQTAFLAASELEVLYGAAGGGKSYAMLADPMRYLQNRNFSGIIFRKTNDELRELKWKSQELYKAAFPEATWREKDSAWVFPSGARLWLTYLDQDNDVHRYQGQSFSYIGWDELTQYPTSFPYNYMRSRLRTTDPSLPLCVRATSNPGGPGHGWVKRMFIDPAPPDTSFPATDIETGDVLTYPKLDRKTRLPHPKAGQFLFSRRFIPANLYDNPSLMYDDKYETNLMSMPETQRRQFLEGDWDVADGAAFGEFRQKIHVCKPFPIHKSWKRFRSADYGYASHSAVHWYAIDPIYETLFVYRELYVKGKTGKELANMISTLEKDEKILYGVLDSSVWRRRGQTGPSIAEEMIVAGCRWKPSDRGDGSRSAGKNRLHELLKVEPLFEHVDGSMGRPGIVFFDTCRQIISDLPVIPVDPDGDDDIDKRYASDHTYDSIRYGIMSRPRARSPFEFDRYRTGPTYRPADLILGY